VVAIRVKREDLAGDPMSVTTGGSRVAEPVAAAQRPALSLAAERDLDDEPDWEGLEPTQAG